MRMAMRPYLLAQRSPIITKGLPMTSSAQQQMKDFWKKNQTLKRPSSPWIVYKWHLPMMTSLTHRFTGISMGITLYAISYGLFLAPGDFPAYIEFVKNLEISPLIMFPVKGIVAFPLVYHYINGIRHLLWDIGYGYKLSYQYKSGTVIYVVSVAISAFLASIAYWA